MRLHSLLVGGALALLLAIACYDFDASLARCEAPGGRCTVISPDPNCVPSGPDEPDDGFVDSDCDGIDGVASAGLFVDPVAGDDLAAGTPEAPMRTLAAALQRAQGAGKRRLYLGAGAFNESELTLAHPVDLHGGYAGREGRWARGGTFVSHLDGGAIGLTVRGVDAGVLLDHVLVSSLTPTAPGSPSIALRVLRSPQVTVHQSVLSAGRGSAGAPGTAGAPGRPGARGVDGGSSVRDSSGTAGAGGRLTCPSDGLSGGGGGLGISQSAGAPGSQGWLASGTAAIAGGDGGTTGIVDCGLLNMDCTCTGNPGGAGAAGTAGAPGLAGAGGSGPGSVSADTWVAAPAPAGEPGTPGAGGGGGGGGGSCDVRPAAAAAGGAGGGGGAGGCGGEGGAGGQGGGASIAVLVLDGQVSLEVTTLRTAGGGTGGPGGSGGAGGGPGAGGSGGLGGRIPDASSPEDGRTYTTNGGAGGSGGGGGPGGAGGAGGGGAGGPSVGVWCTPSQPVETTGRLVLQLGPGGPGGVGPGNPGEAGVSVDTVGCTLM